MRVRMKNKKNNNSYLVRDFKSIYGMLRDMVLHGYRDKNGYKNIFVEEKKYDSVLAKIRFMMQEMPRALQMQEKDHKRQYYFLNEPMKWQNNPLTTVFRYALPNGKELFFYMNILESLSDLKCKTAEEISKEILEKYRWYQYSDVEKAVEKTLRKMKNQTIISNKKVKGVRAKSYCMEECIWENDFSKEELADIYYYLDFLKNVMPFELPYYLLQKNLEAYVITKCDKREGLKKEEVFLFHNRNTVNVIDSEKIYALLKGAKSKAVLNMQYTYANLELNRINRKQKEQNVQTPEEKDWEFVVKNLRYDKETGMLYLETINDLNGTSYTYTTPLERVEFKQESNDLFQVFHSIYFERIFQLCSQKDGKWEVLELEKELFKQNYYDQRLYEELLSEKQEYNLFEYAKKEKKYYNTINKPLLFPSTRLHKEALKSLEDLSYTEFFLQKETIEKIKKKLNAFESSWNVKDIINSPGTTKNTKRNPTYKELKKVLEAVLNKKMLVDKTGKSFLPLRVRYAIRKDEFQILAYEKAADACTLVTWEDIDFQKVGKREFVDEKEQKKWAEKLDEKQETIQIKLESPLKTVNVDNMLTERLFMFLSAYERKVTYFEEEGRFEIEVKCYQDDKEELLEYLKTYSTLFLVQITEKDCSTKDCNPFLVCRAWH